MGRCRISPELALVLALVLASERPDLHLPTEGEEAGEGTMVDDEELSESYAVSDRSSARSSVSADSASSVIVSSSS